MRRFLVKAAFVTTCTSLAAVGSATGLIDARNGLDYRSEAGAARTRLAAADPGGRPHSFYFARAAYSGVRNAATARMGAELGTTDPLGAWDANEACGGGFCAWATDYPKGDRQFLTVLRRLTNIDASPSEHAVRLDDPGLRRFPFIYAVEVGYMGLTAAEVRGLRSYLLAGGFLVVDDFWGSVQWQDFEAQMRRVFPEYRIVDIPTTHPLFSSFYDIDEIIQVPNLGQGMPGAPTRELDGAVPHVRGIFDDKGRLMAVINWNTDFGDAWEWAEQPNYMLKYSTFAYQMGVNIVVYAMSH